ncbi:hypothetical protein Q3G72_031674 [Acer saccharum]|nr:hypothetical protein Q3G72_031674 [Acer saccharum]
MARPSPTESSEDTVYCSHLPLTTHTQDMFDWRKGSRYSPDFHKLSTMSNPHSECLRVEKGKLIFPRIPQEKDGHLGLDRGSSSAKESSERG